MGYYYISTVAAFDSLRRRYLLNRSTIMEYKMHEEECDIDFDVKDGSRWFEFRAT